MRIFLVSMKYKTNFDEIVSLTKELSGKNTSPTCPIILGFDSDQNVVIEDLVNLESILINGQTGSGKSNFLHSIICQFLLRLKPGDFQLFLVDPKKVDLVMYQGLPQLISQVFTEPFGAVSNLKELVDETDRRLAGSPNKKIVLVVIDTFSDLIYANLQDFTDRISYITSNSSATNIFVMMSDSCDNPNVFTDRINSVFKTKLSFGPKPGHFLPYNLTSINVPDPGIFLH